MICSTCRLVNGQAPPGIKTLEELGRWRCGGCNAWNGEESETTKVLADIRGQSKSQSQSDSTWEPVSKTDADNHSSVGDATDEAVLVAASEDGSSAAETPEEEEQVEEKKPEPQPTRKSTRVRSRGGKNKG